MQDEFVVSHGNFLEGYIKDLSLRMDKCHNGDYRIFVVKTGKDDMFLGTFTPANNDDQQELNAAHLPNGADETVEGNLNADQSENDRPKACRANHDAFRRMRNCPKWCPECGKRLSAIYANE